MTMPNIYRNPRIREQIFGKYENSRIRWDKITCWDNCISEDEKDLISKAKKERGLEKHCPYLKLKEDYFYYCKSKADQFSKEGSSLNERIPNSRSSEFLAKVNPFCLQVLCINEDEHYKECEFFKSPKAEKNN